MKILFQVIIQIRETGFSKPDGAVPDELLKDLLDKAYCLMLRGFSKKKAEEDFESQLLRNGMCRL